MLLNLQLQAEAAKLKYSSRTKLVVVGIGSAVSVDELKLVASEPYDTNVILVDDYHNLYSVNQRLKGVSCYCESSSVISVIDDSCGR